MLLNRYFSFFWLLLAILTGGISNLFLGILLHVYEKDAWYTKWYYWVLGIFFLLFPSLIMLTVLIIEITVKICIKLDVPGKQLYAYPYPWILGIMVPVVGWAFFVLLFIYINLFYCIRLFQGKAETFK